MLDAYTMYKKVPRPKNYLTAAVFLDVPSATEESCLKEAANLHPCCLC